MNDTAPSRIHALTSWRGIFILSVVLFHSGERLFMELATSGVVGFFIMSGFLMRMKHQPELIRGRRFKSFIVNRALRIYSLHWFSFALLMAVTFGVSAALTYMSWGALVPNLLLVQSFVPDVDVFFSFNTPTWFLGDLLLCYLCFPFIATWLDRIRLRWQLLLFAVLQMVYFIIMCLLADPDLVTYAHVFPPFRLYEFTAGIIIYNVYKALRLRFTHWNVAKATLAEVLVVGVYVGLIVFSQTWDYQYKDKFNDSVMWEIPLSLLVLVFAVGAGSEGLISRLLHWKPLVWLGSVCFEMFLLHFVAGLVFGYLVSPFLGHFGIMVYDHYAYGQLPILLVMCYVMHRWFTLPVFAWASRLCARLCV